MATTSSKTTQERYDVAQYDSEEERARDPQGPPLENKSSAAAYIASKIQGASGVYAIMGGFALVLLGSRRSTRDVDLVTDLTMAQVWSIIEGDSRLIVPKSRMTADVIKIFVKTGPGHDRCKESKNVEVDIALPGVKGTPRHIAQSTVQVGAGRDALSSLAVPYILRAKMYHYADRAFERDLTDIEFLLRTFEAEIKNNAGILRKDDVETFLESEDISEHAKARYAKILGM